MYCFKHYQLKYLIIIIALFSTSCSPKKPTYTHGINSIENKYNILVINKSNKNDVIATFGDPHSKGIADDDIWIYVERRFEKGSIYKLGKNQITKNNIVKLKFDKYGLLVSKNIVDKEAMNKIVYSKDVTKNTRASRSFVEGFLSSIKTKMYGKRDTAKEDN